MFYGGKKHGHFLEINSDTMVDRVLRIACHVIYSNYECYDVKQVH